MKVPILRYHRAMFPRRPGFVQTHQKKYNEVEMGDARDVRAITPAEKADQSQSHSKNKRMREIDQEVTNRYKSSKTNKSALPKKNNTTPISFTNL